MEYQTLRSGGKMPIVGYGTFQAVDNTLEKALNEALKSGYRHIDTATLYANEHIIGKVLYEWISSGRVKRDELFIVTKLPPFANRPEDVETCLKKSLENLRLDYVDLYLIHTPFGVTTEDTLNFGKMKIDLSTDHVGTWKVMEKQMDCGRTKAIGLSNFNIKQIQRILDNCTIKPDNIQVEYHLYLQQPEIVRFCRDNGIVMTSYSCLGTRGVRESMGFSWINKQLPEMLENDVLTKIAKKHGRTPAQVLLRHIIQKRISVVPKSVNPRRLMENIQIFDFQLDAEDVKCLDGQDAGEEGRIVRFLFIPKIADHPEYPFQINL